MVTGKNLKRSRGEARGRWAAKREGDAAAAMRGDEDVPFKGHFGGRLPCSHAQVSCFVFQPAGQMPLFGFGSCKAETSPTGSEHHKEC